MKGFRFILLGLTAWIAVHLPVNAQVVINEFSCANVAIITNSFNDQDDYIELYNSGANPVDIGSWYLSDKAGNPLKWQFPPSVIINPGAFLLVYASSQNTFAGGVYHTNFKLTQTRNERIVLSNASGILVDQIQIIPTQVNHCRIRYPDGSPDWRLCLSPTPGASNAAGSPEYSPKPVMSLPAGNYTATFTLTITSTEPNASIRYTLDGTEPTSLSTLYVNPLPISQNTVVRAKGFSANSNVPASFTETNTYFFNLTHQVPILSLAGTQLNTLLNGNSTVRIGSFEYFNTDFECVDESTGEFNKHGNDSWAYQQRGVDFICRDEFGYNAEIRDQIFPIKEREDYQRLIIKAAANDNYPFAQGAHVRDAYVHTLSQLANLNLDERTSLFVVVYMNGQYWGVYDLREKVDDHDFTEFYYDQPKESLQFLKTWGGTWSEYGGTAAQTDWNTLRTFILGNDMTIPANFAHVDSLFDWRSLIDYVVLNSYVVCSDWLNWNTGWWRGLNEDGEAQKWRYVLWDMDATFGHYINYTGIPNTSPGADPCNPEFLNNPGGQGHIPILNQLMLNETFNQYYISRFIDLSNTSFSCTYMQQVLDSMINVIEPEMNMHITRWGGTYAAWETEVLQLKDFIDDRCTELDSGLIDCYDVTGPYELVFKVEPPGTGRIKVNSLWIDNFPFQGEYFGDIDVLLEAEPLNGTIFQHWELITNTFLPQTNAIEGKINPIAPDTIIAVFKYPIPEVELGNDTSICQGTSISLDASNPGAVYSWSNGTHNQFLNVSTSGTYAVTVSDNGYTVIDQITVTIDSLPQVSLRDDLYVCANIPVSIQPDYEHALTFTWSDNSHDNNLVITQPGTYWVEVTNSCGEASDTTVVSQGFPPIIELGPEATIFSGETITLDASAIDATYLWQDHSTNPTLVVSEPGYYWVIVENICGSTFDDVTINTNIFLKIPTAFSPNDDGLNDYFTLIHQGVFTENFTLKIFDRWGILIFESNAIQNTWDGKIKGKPAPLDAYIYQVFYEDYNGKQFQQGTVSIIR